MMKFKTALLVAAVVVAPLGAGSVYFAYSTFAYSGTEAIARLTEDDRPYLLKYDQLQRGMSYDHVVAILGEPDRDALGGRATWKVNQSSLSQISVYFAEGKVRKARWLHLGRFVMEK
jgi:hypothetical protein